MVTYNTARIYDEGLQAIFKYDNFGDDGTSIPDRLAALIVHGYTFDRAHTVATIQLSEVSGGNYDRIELVAFNSDWVELGSNREMWSIRPRDWTTFTWVQLTVATPASGIVDGVVLYDLENTLAGLYIPVSFTADGSKDLTVRFRGDAFYAYI